MAHDLTLSSATYNSSGKFGSSLSGGSGIASSVLSGTQLSIAGWVKTTSSGSTAAAFGQGDVAWVGIDNTGKALGHYGKSPDVGIAGTVAINDGAWHYVELCVDSAAGGYLFVDGVLVGSSTTASAFNFTSAANRFGVRLLPFGAAPTTGLAWSGEVDEVAAYSGVRHTASYTAPTAAPSNNEANLLALYHFDGDGTDSAGLTSGQQQNQTGTAKNLALTSATFNSTGKIGQSLNGGYGMAANPLPSSGPFTIEVWVKSTGTDYTIVAGCQYGAWIGHQPSGYAWAYYGNQANTTASTATSSTKINDGAWHHLSWNVDPSGATPSKLYVDGVLAASITANHPISVTDPFGVKAFGSNTSQPLYTVVGEVDEVAVFSGIRRTGSFTPPTTATSDNDSALLALWHLDGSGSDTAAPASAVAVAITDANVYWSPANWDTYGSYKSTNNPGAYVKLAFSGTSISASIDVSAMVAASLAAASYPIVRTVIDGASFVDTQLTSATSSIVRNGLASGAHTLELFLLAVDINNGDRWTTPVQALRITGFVIDAGAALSAPGLRSKLSLHYGDSISEGYLAQGTTMAQPGGNNSMLTVPSALAQALDCEYGLIAFSGQGYQQAGNGNVPAFPSAYGLFSAGRSRLVNGLLSPQPDYIFVEHGANGSTSAANVQAMLSNLRAAAPNAKIFQLVPRGGYARSAITAGVAAVSDANLFLIDLGTGYQSGIAAWTGVANLYSLDGLHPNPQANMRAGTGFAKKIQAALDGAVPPTLTSRTVTLTVGDTSGVLANLSGLKVAAFDEATPDLRNAPRYRSASQTTNASGVLAFTMQSSLAAGATCGVSVQLADGRNFDTTATVA